MPTTVEATAPTTPLAKAQAELREAEQALQEQRQAKIAYDSSVTNFLNQHEPTDPAGIALRRQDLESMNTYATGLRAALSAAEQRVRDAKERVSAAQRSIEEARSQVGNLKNQLAMASRQLAQAEEQAALWRRQLDQAQAALPEAERVFQALVSSSAEMPH